LLVAAREASFADYRAEEEAERDSFFGDLERDLAELDEGTADEEPGDQLAEIDGDPLLDAVGHPGLDPGETVIPAPEPGSAFTSTAETQCDRHPGLDPGPASDAPEAQPDPDRDKEPEARHAELGSASIAETDCAGGEMNPEAGSG
jgi:hypothetical protein